MVIVDFPPFSGKMLTLKEYATRFFSKEENRGLIKKINEGSNDPVAWFYTYMLENNEFEPFVVQCQMKNQKEAIQYFNKGVNAYEKGEDISSINFLTVCIAASPEKDPVLPIAYMCRAAAFLRLERFSACLMDINRALQAEAHLTTKMSESAKRVLLERKELCITLLEQEKFREKSTAKSTSNEDDKTKKVSAAKEDKCSTKQPTSSDSQSKRRKNEKNMQPDQQGKKTSSEIDEKLTNPNDEESTSPIDKLMNPNNENRFPLPSIANPNKKIYPASAKPNEKLYRASAKVKIHYSETHGRHLVATEDIKPGEVLFKEESYASVLFPQFYTLCCRRCFVRCEALIPCPKCLLGTYCSDSCRQKAFDEFHKIECPILGTLVKLEVSGGTHLALRLLLVATNQGTGLDSMMQDPTYKSPEPNLGPIEGEFISEEYCNVHNLMDLYTTTLGKFSKPMIARKCYEVSILLYLLQQTAFFDESVNCDKLAEKILFAGNLLLKYLYLSSINYRPVKDLVEIPPEEATAEKYCRISLIGYGLYTLHSLMNHSCDPNTVSVNHQNSIVCYATQPIAEGDQIFTHYNWVYTRYYRDFRQDQLTSYYCFTCECEPCEVNWCPKEDQKEYSIEMIRIKNKNEDRIKKYTVKRLENMEQKLYRILEEDRWTPTDEDVNFVIDFISVFYKCVQRPYYSFTVAWEYLMLLLEKRGNAYQYEDESVICELSSLVKETS